MSKSAPDILQAAIDAIADRAALRDQPSGERSMEGRRRERVSVGGCTSSFRQGGRMNTCKTCLFWMENDEDEDGYCQRIRTVEDGRTLEDDVAVLTDGTLLTKATFGCSEWRKGT